MSKLNQIVRETREAQEMSRSSLAKKLKISKGYLEHIEYGTPVHISERLVMGLKWALGLKVDLSRLAKRHNARVAKVIKARRKSA